MTRRLSICAMTTVRNDALFLPRWIAHYGTAFGRENLLIILDGQDQELPPDAGPVNVIRLPHQPLPRVPAMRRRAMVMSHFARGMFKYYDMAIATDVDEFIVLDPRIGLDLPDYLSRLNRPPSSISALGLDVGQHLQHEGPLDISRPFLDQRSFAHVSSRYTKPIIATRPVIWGSGMHRVKGRNFHIDPNLFLFHFGMVDFTRSTGTTNDPDRLATGWGGHLSRREALFSIITNAQPMDGDSYFSKARLYQTLLRPLYALNKPRMISGNPVIRIPNRFKGLV